MSDDESNQPNQKIFNQYQIKITSNMDYINIFIQNNNTSNIYESKFNLEKLHQYRLLMGNLTINEIIEENENNLKLILISHYNYPNVDLILQKENILEKLINEIEGIKNENKMLKNNYEIIKNEIELIEDKNNKLNMKIELIEKEKNNKTNENDKLEKEKIEKNIEECKNLNIRINLIEKENEELKNKIKLLEKNNEEYLNKIEKEKINNEELNNKIEKENEIINEIKNKIKILERYHKYKYKIQLTKCNLQNINSIQSHKNMIRSISIFPLGNIISVSKDKSIIIYDINLNILQNIQKAHNDFINYVEIKDENNFITCSLDQNIKLWIKNENKFIINKIIYGAHELGIIKVIYYSNNNLIRWN